MLKYSGKLELVLLDTGRLPLTLHLSNDSPKKSKEELFLGE